jgi:S1-C subfamily serine protease
MQLNLSILTAIASLAASGIACAQSSGTAFVVAPGLLVTNHHVIDDCGAIEVVASDGRRPATIVDSVQIIDLALLRVYGLRGGVASLRTQSPVLLGESATVFGFPLGGALSSTGNFTTGVVSSLRGLGDPPLSQKMSPAFNLVFLTLGADGVKQCHPTIISSKNKRCVV